MVNETKSSSPSWNDEYFNFPVVYVLVEYRVIDGIMSSLIQTPIFTSEKIALRMRNKMIKQTGNAFGMFVLPVCKEEE